MIVFTILFLYSFLCVFFAAKFCFFCDFHTAFVDALFVSMVIIFGTMAAVELLSIFQG